jgi:undecaprenyl diphosphate synthase
VVETLQEVERRTATSTGLILNLPLIMGGHRDLVHAAKQVAEACKKGILLPEDINEATFAKAYVRMNYRPWTWSFVPAMSNAFHFLPWQSAYAELMFLKVLWPDVTKATIYEAVANFQTRNRRFGGV